MYFLKPLSPYLIFWKADWLGGGEGEGEQGSADEEEEDKEEWCLLQQREEAGHARRGEADPEDDLAAPEALHEALPRAGLSFSFFLFLSFFFF